MTEFKISNNNSYLYRRCKHINKSIVISILTVCKIEINKKTNKYPTFMKTPRLITAVIAILLFSNLIFAGNPENYATKKVVKLCKDIVLTDSQKVIIQAKAKVFASKMQSASLITNNIEKTSIQNQAVQGYKMALDSVLTTEQKTQLITKRNERRDIIMNKLKSKK